VSSAVGLETYDVRFPILRIGDGSHALTRTPGDASTCAITEPGAQDGRDGHGFGFTFGRSDEGADDSTRARGLVRGLHQPEAPTTLRVPKDAALTRHDRIASDSVGIG
jgi:hypothetical protein